MKSIFILLLSYMLLSPAIAQDKPVLTKEAKAREKIIAARIAYITEKLNLTPAEAEKFWPIYNEFDQKRKDIRSEAKELRKSPDLTLSKEDADKNAIARQHQVRQKELDLERDYSKRLLEVVSAQKVRALPKTEKDFRDLLLRQIQQQQAIKEQQQLQRDRKDLRPKNN